MCIYTGIARNRSHDYIPYIFLKFRTNVHGLVLFLRHNYGYEATIVCIVVHFLSRVESQTFLECEKE